MPRPDVARLDVPGATTYRRLLRLYPRALREAYGAEMVLLFTELRRRHGRRAWGRVLLDLAVSVPRTRLESVMSTTLSTRTVVALVVAVAAPLSLLALTAFGPAGLPVPLGLAGLALAQRSRLARSLGAGPAPSAVRSAAVGLAVSVVALAGVTGSWIYHLRTFEGLSTAAVMLHNLIGFAALAGTLAFTVLLAVRLRRRPPTVAG